MFEILTVAYQETKTAVLPQMPLELAILEWGEKEGQGRGPAAGFLPVSAPSSLAGAANEVRAAGSSSSGVTPHILDNESNENFVSPRASHQVLTNNFFTKLINEVKLQNHLVAGVLRSCPADEIQKNKLKIIAKSNFHKEKLEEAKN